MKALFLTAVSGLKIKSDLKRGEKIDNSSFLTNNKKKIKKELDPNLKALIGNMEYNSILNSETIIYSMESIPEGLSPEKYLVSKLYKIEKFFSALWMLKDNCANNELGFLLYNSNGVPAVSSNFIALVNSTAVGKTKGQTITLTRQELKKVGNFNKSLFNPENMYSVPTTQLLKGNDRISRAYYLIQAARTQSDLAIKISNYCTAFESLFSTSSIELTLSLHKKSSKLVKKKLEEAYG